MDVAFFHDVLHHVENRAAYLKSLAGYLKPGARIVTVEFNAADSPHKDQPALVVSKEEGNRLLAGIGFTPSEDHALFTGQMVRGLHQALTVAVAALLSLPAVRIAAQDAPAIVAFENLRLIPGDGRPAMEQATLLVEKGRVRQVGATFEVRVPAGAARVDMRGKTVVPAFVNAHTHPGFQRGASYSRDNYTRDQILQDLDRALYFGVAAVLSQGIDPGDVAFRFAPTRPRAAWAARDCCSPAAGSARPTPAPARRRTKASPTS